jgi:hypothetical protein
MNGFERSSGHDREADALESLFPPDFTSEEAEIAREMRGLYPIEDEVLPPLYVQTMMDDPWMVPVVPTDERTLVSTVFSRLRVARPSLLPKLTALPLWPSLVETIAQVNTVSRTLVAAAGMALATMILSVLFTGPAFAQGLQILLGHTGVQQVQTYPSAVRTGAAGDSTHLTPEAQGALAWFGSSVDGYDFQTMRLEHTQSWSAGPVVHMQYARPSSASDGAGVAVIDVREFQVAPNLAAVLQVVKIGSADQTWVGTGPAVYVDGGWVQRGARQEWQSGTRAELIFERDGLVFWLVGDQRAGVTEDELVKVARQLQSVSLSTLQPSRLSVDSIGREFIAMLRLPASDEIYELVSAGDQQGGDGSPLVSATAPGTVYQYPGV